MRRLSSEEVKRIQIEILDVVSSFCDEHGINYWLDSGTLLGAIRHKGYIPWDDDIDIGMLREDYDKFSELFNANNQKYKFVCVENTKDFYTPFGKVIDTATILYEPDKQGSKLAINIDIFIYDNAPDDNRIVRKMYNRRDRLLLVALFSRGAQILPNDSGLRVLAKNLIHFLCKPFSSRKLVLKAVANSKRFSKFETRRVGNFTAVSRIAVDKHVFDSFIDVEFEGKMYKAPAGYDEWLTDFYGDYMQLPPKDKQVSHHLYEAYLID